MPTETAWTAAKARSVAALTLSQIAVLSVWFSSAAVLGPMGREAGLAPAALAWLSAAVQLGFAAGALGLGLLGLADRFDPRRVLLGAALLAAAATAGLLIAPIGGWQAALLRALTGAALAGVYPVAMKIAAGWGLGDRALLVSLLVGALTLGSASPHLLALVGGPDWRTTVALSAGAAALGGLGVLAADLGPHHARARGVDLGAAALLWRDRRLRWAMAGYLGHMWELYAFWAWVGAMAAGSFAAAGAAGPEAEQAGRAVAFAAIALGGLACLPAGLAAVRRGSAPVAAACLRAGLVAGLASALLWGGPVWLAAGALILWGVAVIPDSALYSTLIAEAAPPERLGSLLTLQTALGFLLTAGTVQALPFAAAALGWPGAMALLALGPAAGLWALRRLKRERR